MSSSASLTSEEKSASADKVEKNGKNDKDSMASEIASEAVRLTSKLSEMTLASPPPPGKIRRRNALTSTDLFLKSREMQQLEEQYRASITEDRASKDPITAKALQKDLENLTLGPLRRKKAVSRSPPSVSSSQNQTKADEKRKEPLIPLVKSSGKMHISLHEDLNKALSSPMKMKNQLPESLLSRYRVQDRKETDRTAVILYRPRTSLGSPTSTPEKDKEKLRKPSVATAMSVREKRSGMMNRSSSDASASYSSLSGSGSGKSGGAGEEEMDLIVSSNSIAVPTHARIVSLES